jgi:thymidylate synthase (FAD)
MKLIKPYYIIESEIDGEKILKHIEQAARTCYKTEDKADDFEKTKKFIRGIIKRGHESTIEHYSFTVRFIIDRGVSHELVRHRLCAFSQESTRYCNYCDEKFGNDIIYIIPPWIDLEEGIYRYNNDPLPSATSFIYNENILPIIYKNQRKTNWNLYNWLKILSDSEKSYKELISNGWSPQEARTVLPNSLKTEIVTTANLREWRHIFKLRAVGSAGNPHPQMEEIMKPLLLEVQNKIPVVFDDI